MDCDAGPSTNDGSGFHTPNPFLDVLAAVRVVMPPQKNQS